MRDEELDHLLGGWGAVFLGLGLMGIWALGGLTFAWILSVLLIGAGLLVVVYAFLRFRLPEIINFFKSEEFKTWTQSLGR